jgi:hypothetical protein
MTDAGAVRHPLLAIELAEDAAPARYSRTRGLEQV